MYSCEELQVIRKLSIIFFVDINKITTFEI